MYQAEEDLPEINSSINEMEQTLEEIANLSDKCVGFNSSIYIPQVQDRIKSLYSLMTCFKKKSQQYDGFSEYPSTKLRFDNFTRKLQTTLPNVIKTLKESEASSFSNNNNTSNKNNNLNKATLLSSSHENPNYTEPLLDQQMIDGETDMISLIENDVTNILSQMRELNSIFNQTFEELQKQRHKIVSIDSITNNSKKEMKKGNQELEKAGNHQKSSRKTLIVIFSIIFAIVLAIIAFLAIHFSKKKKKPE
ncbi:hypothetical protein TRFO_09076 [Tritrichomonas foetus]|uniref:t-SNARE coiled-coil homology domain-containing protein n=1 Tax=Tritrichomonas foetus TaxID=1144522 RepID=A0A1J4JKV5_9EUKA|nr:hypothetical protein TRFO_09076 [Tritrichomonas foetus]|eukprot:OHS98197.1 hypothetical protein TRFO_09076 [Tritrichomonas foetus]